jgi:PAB1-binding protein PBP1
MDIKEKIEGLRAELHRHNYNYYVLNAPEISDKEFDEKIRELQDLEQAHPEYKDENSPTMRVGSDINKNFTQVAHKYPMLSLANTYSEAEVTDFYDRVRKALNEDSHNARRKANYRPTNNTNTHPTYEKLQSLNFEVSMFRTPHFLDWQKEVLRELLFHGSAPRTLPMA